MNGDGPEEFVVVVVAIGGGGAVAAAADETDGLLEDKAWFRFDRLIGGFRLRLEDKFNGWSADAALLVFIERSNGFGSSGVEDRVAVGVKRQ